MVAAKNSKIQPRFAIVAARFNENVTQRLLEGALAAFRELELPDPQVVRVPGAFEVPLAANHLAKTGQYAGIACLGCLIRGDTPHFDYIASAVSHGIMSAALHTGVPMSFGVLTTDTLAQALERSQPGPANKGAEAVHVIIEMAGIFQR